MVGLWNPHIISCIERDVLTVLSGLDISGIGQFYQLPVQAILAQIDSAASILGQIPGIEESFVTDSGKQILPLAYKLLPKLEDLEEDDPTCQKFGGVPDLRWVLPVDSGDSNYIDLVARTWPRCGACYRPMRFIGQFNPGLRACLLHSAICDPLSSIDKKRMRSGMGTLENLSLPRHTRWWYVFMCPESLEHCDNPNYDAKILVDSRLKSWDRVAKKDTEKKFAATREFMASIGELKEVDEQANDSDKGPQIPLKKITDFQLGLELDPYGRLEGDLSAAVDAAIIEHPEVFGGKSNYSLFGRPISQQVDPKRFYSQCGTWPGSPLCMSTILNFLSSGDMSYQLYGDFGSSAIGGEIFCKIDASCT